jgi:hypothetical protein
MELAVTALNLKKILGGWKMSRWTMLMVTVVLSLLVAMGCSGGGFNPSAPSTDLTAGQSVGANTTQTHLWGYYDVYFDIPNKTVRADLNRNVMFAANVTSFLNGSYSNMSFNIIGTPQDPGGKFVDVDIDVTLKHPFPGLPQYNGYDVRGVFIGNGSKSLSYNTKLKYAAHGSTDQEMFDYALTTGDTHAGKPGMPDGYTRWWNPTEFLTAGLFGYTPGKLATKNFTGTALLNPYKYFADGLMVGDDAFTFLTGTTGHGVFSSGSSNTRNYYLRFPLPNPNVTYAYAVVAQWKGDAPTDHPTNSIEAAVASVNVIPDIYFKSETEKGGNLKLDIQMFGWNNIQPSSITIESTVLLAPYKYTGSAIGGDLTYSTYHIDIPADNILSTGGNEFWVIAEYEGYSYKNDFGVTNGAGDDKLAAFFRYDLPVASMPFCNTTFISITPDKAGAGSNINDATIVSTDLIAGPYLGARLTKTGKTPVVATDVKLIDNTTMTCDFNLTGADKGYWNVEVINGCGGYPGIGVNAFQIMGGITVSKTGDLPTPLPTSTSKDFSIVGSNTFKHAGIYYHCSNLSAGNYTVNMYPLDYSAAGTTYRTIVDPFFGNIEGLMMGYQYMDNICVEPAGGCVWTNNYTGYMSAWGNPGDGPFWWTYINNGNLANGWLYFNMKSVDLAIGFGNISTVWGYWVNNSAGVDGATYNLKPGYGQNDYSALEGYFTVDHVGNVDGEVAIPSTAYAVDDKAVGLDEPFDSVHYYLESAPNVPDIEVLANVTTLSFPIPLATIKDFVGTPIDIACLYSYGKISGAEGNWVCVLEDNGDSTWQIAIFDQAGSLIARYPLPIAGKPLHIGCDNTNTKIHVWTDDAGTLKYYIFVYS